MSFGRIIGKDEKDTASSSIGGSTSGSGTSPFNSNDKTKYEAVLGKGSKVVGNLTFSGPVEIGGFVEGEIVAQDRILITESAEINAKIIGAEVIIQGTVNGDIIASKKLTLKKPAKVFGNISSANLSIEEGVVFEGKCSMATADSSDKYGSQSKVVSTAKVAGSI